MKTCVIFNPVARGNKARHFQSHLASVASQCTLKPTISAGSARELAAQSVREGYEVIVAAGGDGTLNEVLNGIADEPDGLSRVRLAVLPLGTINVFAKELSIPANFKGAWRVIQEAKETVIDLPVVSFAMHAQQRRRYFGQLAGAGLDSAAIELVNWDEKKLVGSFAYVLAGFRALSQRLPQIVASNGKDAAGGELILIGNGRFYGGRYVVFPYADLRDGLLEVVVFPRVNLDMIIRAGWGLLTEQFATIGKAIHMKGSQIDLTSSSAVPFQVDGENIGHLPATFSIERNKLRVLVP